MVIDERIRDDGSYDRTRLVAADGGVAFEDDSGFRCVLPAHVVVTVMRRYGRPLEDDTMLDGPALPLGDGLVLRGLKFVAAVDAGPRDYAVLCAEGQPALAALCNTLASALRFLATGPARDRT
jgi:hypothetical protein